ncbi:MAG TPA: hypothetical protein VHA13_02255 [Gammaproteobacteria bacterium]|nr:hypothetical protein [Gammaproteobacteria bacterium]
MQLIEARERLLRLKQPVIQTSDASACLNLPYAQASKILARLEHVGQFVRLMRGKWATTRELDPLILPEYLTLPYPSYVSLQTALFYHGMISQIPHTIYAVSLARTRVYRTPIGSFSIHHLQPSFFFGFETIGQIKMATPEKALIDLLYFSPANSRLFKKQPELDLTKSFNIKKAKNIITKIPSQRTKTLVQQRFQTLINLVK